MHTRPPLDGQIRSAVSAQQEQQHCPAEGQSRYSQGSLAKAAPQEVWQSGTLDTHLDEIGLQHQHHTVLHANAGPVLMLKPGLSRLPEAQHHICANMAAMCRCRKLPLLAILGLCGASIMRHMATMPTSRSGSVLYLWSPAPVPTQPTFRAPTAWGPTPSSQTEGPK